MIPFLVGSWNILLFDSLKCTLNSIFSSGFQVFVNHIPGIFAYFDSFMGDMALSIYLIYFSTSY